jgi:hypothetical protein
MTNPIAAGLRYFVPVFAIAFVFGTLRTLVVAPRTGDVVAVLIEVPLILLVSWWVCRRAAKGVSPRPLPRLVMGATALALLMLTEFTMSVRLFGRSPAAFLMGFGTLAGQLGLAGQIGFGLMPLLVRRE